MLSTMPILSNPLHRAVTAFDQQASNLPGGALAGALLGVSDQPDAPAALARLATGSTSAEVKTVARAVLVLRSHPEQLVQRLENPGFEPVAGKVSATASHRSAPPGWQVWFRPDTPGRGEAVPAAARSGKRGFVLCGAEASCVLQTVPVRPGERYLATVYVRGKLSRQAESKLVAQWQDAAGQWLTKAAPCVGRLPACGTPDWARLCVLAEVPAQAAQLVFSVSAYNQGPDDVLQIDDAGLQCIP